MESGIYAGAGEWFVPSADAHSGEQNTVVAPIDLKTHIRERQ